MPPFLPLEKSLSKEEQKVLAWLEKRRLQGRKRTPEEITLNFRLRRRAQFSVILKRAHFSIPFLPTEAADLIKQNGQRLGHTEAQANAEEASFFLGTQGTDLLRGYRGRCGNATHPFKSIKIF